MKRILPLLLVALLSFIAVEAQEHNILIYESSFMPESGLAIDKIGQDPSKRDCARIKMHINRMTSTEIDQLKVNTIGGIVKVTKQYVSLEGDGLIIELTAKPSTRFYLHHDKYGDSNEVNLNLEGNKEYRLSAELKVFYSIAISCDAKEAEVYIDDTFQGRIGDDYTLTAKDIIPGTHELRVVSGTSVVKRDIEVNSDNIYFRVDVNETPSLPQYVVFTVTPKDAIVVIDNVSKRPDADGVVQVKLHNGLYTYHVSAHGYHEEKGTVLVGGDKKVEMKVNLKPAHGWVVVESNQVLQGASVYIDDHYVSTVPFPSYKLASGEHTIKIIKDLYHTYEDTITIKDGETLKYAPTLTANFANVTVTTAKGADIYIDNKKKGTTTWTGNLETGFYIFEARKANHKTTTLPKEIKAQPQKQRINLDDPEPIMGSINLTCNPKIANITIDGKDMGETPLITSLIVGSHTVTIRKAGYKDETKVVTIKEGATEDVEFILKEDIAPGTLSVTSDQSDATVFVDGKLRGKTSGTFTAEAGTHKVVVEKSGYHSYSEEVYLPGGTTQSVNAHLKPTLTTRFTRNWVPAVGIYYGWGIAFETYDNSYKYFGEEQYESGTDYRSRSSFGLMLRLWGEESLFNIRTGLQLTSIHGGLKMFSVPTHLDLQFHGLGYSSPYISVGTNLYSVGYVNSYPLILQLGIMNHFGEVSINYQLYKSDSAKYHDGISNFSHSQLELRCGIYF